MSLPNQPPSYQQPSLASQAIIDAGRKYFVPNYAPKPLVLTRGDNARIWDKDGNEYIDMGCGISVTNLGHGNAKLQKALAEQSEQLWHVSNLYYNEPSVRLAEELVQAAEHCAERVFFCNSGAEANEAAIKIARRYAHQTYPDQPDKREIVTFEGGFHGRTLATVTATPQPKYQEGFGPLPGGFVYCPFNDTAAAEKAINERTCAVLVEPIQGEGGINPAADGFLSRLRELCDQVGALLICDEIQTGMGRTGKLFTHQWQPGLKPDIVPMAKALAGGLPLGAVLVGEKAHETLQPGSHGTTFGGNPAVCAVARVMLNEVRQPALLENVARQGETLMSALHKLNDELALFSQIRGRGLMIGAQLNETWAGRAAELSDVCQQRGALILIAGNNDVLRFLPPLTISDEEMAVGIERVSAALHAVAAS